MTDTFQLTGKILDKSKAPLVGVRLVLAGSIKVVRDGTANEVYAPTPRVTTDAEGRLCVADGKGAPVATNVTLIDVGQYRLRAVNDGLMDPLVFSGAQAVDGTLDIADIIPENPTPDTTWTTALADLTALVEGFEGVADASVADLVNDDESLTGIAVRAAAPAVPDATTTTKGRVELATPAETVTGTDAVRAATPAGVAAALAAHPGGVTSVNGKTGAVSVASVLGAYVGQTGGAVTVQAKKTAAYTNELWTLANFNSNVGYNSSTLTPSITANATAQTIRTLVNLSNVAGQGDAFRLSGTIATLPADGWAWATIKPVDSGGTILAGAVEQVLATNQNQTGAVNFPFEFDFTSARWGAGGAWLDVTIQALNNATSGTLSIADMSVKRINSVQRPMLYGFEASGGSTLLQPLYDPVAGTYRSVKVYFTPDGVLDLALTTIKGYNSDRIFRYGTADPAFAGAAVSIADASNKTEELLSTGQVSRNVRLGNNDQILNVKKADNTYELRCNTHGGETLRSGGANAKFEADIRGDGTWTTWDGTGQILRPARKFRFTFNTQVQRSDAGSPFANVDHLCTFFTDGMMRMDRTTTFLSSERLSLDIEWMSSHDLSTPSVGRVGNGLIVQDEADIFPKVAPPAVPANTPSTSGGTLAAGTRYYAVTALAEGGESTAGPTVSATNTGSTSSNALTWTAVAGATGYRVYRGASPTTLVHIATVAPIASPACTDLGAAALGVAPPNVNRARQLDATSTILDSVLSETASWSVWYDPILNICFGNLYDREAIASRSTTQSSGVFLGRGAGIKKNYMNVRLVSDGLDVANDRANGDNFVSRLIPSGTVWTATHWAFCYVPADPVNYHLEIAARATDLTELKNAYPTT